MFFLDLLVAPATYPVVDPPDAVEDALRGRDDVEGGRDSPALLEVGDPQLAASELPFDVGLFLKGEDEVISNLSK